MITFKFKQGKEGYLMSSAIREEYLGTGQEDLHDSASIHIIGFEEGKIICTGRMYAVSRSKCIIDNVIVDSDNRMQYVGDTILRALEDKAVQMMCSFIGVFPTDSSRGFFEAEGYCGQDELIKDLTKVRGCRGRNGGL